MEGDPLALVQYAWTAVVMGFCGGVLGAAVYIRIEMWRSRRIGQRMLDELERECNDDRRPEDPTASGDDGRLDG